MASANGNKPVRCAECGNPYVAQSVCGIISRGLLHECDDDEGQKRAKKGGGKGTKGGHDSVMESVRGDVGKLAITDNGQTYPFGSGQKRSWPGQNDWTRSGETWTATWEFQTGPRAGDSDYEPAKENNKIPEPGQKFWGGAKYFEPTIPCDGCAKHFPAPAFVLCLLSTGEVPRKQGTKIAELKEAIALVKDGVDKAPFQNQMIEDDKLVQLCFYCHGEKYKGDKEYYVNRQDLKLKEVWHKLRRKMKEEGIPNEAFIFYRIPNALALYNIADENWNKPDVASASSDWNPLSRASASLDSRAKRTP